MPVYDLYSKRTKRQRGEPQDIYQYTDFPEPFRVQVVHIWKTSFPRPDYYGNGPAGEAFGVINEVLCREYGMFSLGKKKDSAFEQVVNFLISCRAAEQVLDVIELSFRMIDTFARENRHEYTGCQDPDDAIAELNARFREHSVGFQFESGQLVRIDSQMVHANIVKPTLQFLSGGEFKGANQEFLSAHEHYRHGKTKECLNDCLKAFESTMKSICAKRRWPHQPNDTAKSLLEVLFQQGLIPSFMQSHFTGLRATLEAGVPTVRNKLGGHGQGVTEVEVPNHIAAYALHLTATNILLLAQADKALK